MRTDDICICIYVYIHIHMYIHIYMYVYTLSHKVRFVCVVRSLCKCAVYGCLDPPGSGSLKYIHVRFLLPSSANLSCLHLKLGWSPKSALHA